MIQRSELAARLEVIERINCDSIHSNMPQNECAVCRKRESSTTQLSRCSRCKSTWYCSTLCQQKNWNQHLLGCRSYEELSRLRLRMSDPRYIQKNGNGNGNGNGKTNEDIICGEIKVSIRDPLSLIRIKTPIRGIKCYHPQCVDLSTYLSYCHNTKTWQCPICMQALLYEDLVVDKNMLKIINELSDGIDQVELNPDDYSYQVVTLQGNGNGMLGHKSSGKKKKNKRKRKHRELLASLTTHNSNKKRKKKKRKTSDNVNGKYNTRTKRKSKSPKRKKSPHHQVIVID